MNGRRLAKNILIRCVTVLLFVLIFGRSNAGAQYLVILADPVDVRALSGHVQAPNDAGALRDAHVELCDLHTGKILASTNTDAEGNFHFESLGRNEYKLKITMPGFNPLQATLRIRKGRVPSAVFTLPIAT
jgi:hypothetical protein